MTGFSDPVYAEAYVNVNQFDIVLDVLVVNQTSDTLQNLTLELATLGGYMEYVYVYVSMENGCIVIFVKKKPNLIHCFVKEVQCCWKVIHCFMSS